MRCVGPKGKNCTEFHQEDILVEVEYVESHRSEKEKQQMSLFEHFITEGTEKADELAQDGAMLDGGVIAQIRASTVQQKKRRRCVRRCIT